MQMQEFRVINEYPWCQMLPSDTAKNQLSKFTVMVLIFRW